MAFDVVVLAKYSFNSFFNQMYGVIAANNHLRWQHKFTAF